MSDDPGRPGEVSLADALGAVAERLGVAATAADGNLAWARGDLVFATLSGDTAEFRLDGSIAAAARRTPDTAASERGQEWVRFAPRDLDGMALDRVEAWFEAAFRRAG